MGTLSIIPSEAGEIRALIDSAAGQLARATQAADVLDARDHASFAYDACRSAARLLKAKGAHDDVIAAMHQTQADALEVENLAKRRLIEEFEKAQASGQVYNHGGSRRGGNKAEDDKASARDLGLSKTLLHEARLVRDVLVKNPLAVRAALDQILLSKDEPTKARLKKILLPSVREVRNLGRAPTARGKKPSHLIVGAGSIQQIIELRFYEIDPEIRRAEHYLNALRAIKEHGVPHDDQQKISEILSREALASLLSGGVA